MAESLYFCPWMTGSGGGPPYSPLSSPRSYCSYLCSPGSSLQRHGMPCHPVPSRETPVHGCRAARPLMVHDGRARGGQGAGGIQPDRDHGRVWLFKESHSHEFAVERPCWLAFPERSCDKVSQLDTHHVCSKCLLSHNSCERRWVSLFCRVRGFVCLKNITIRFHARLFGVWRDYPVMDG